MIQIAKKLLILINNLIKMKKNMNTISLPFIHPDRKTHHNFFSVCIKAIEDNKDGVLNKKECINKIMKLKEEKLQSKRNFHKTSSLFFGHSRRNNKIKINQIINKRRNLSDIISECEKLEEKEHLKVESSPKLNIEEQKKNSIKRNENIDGLKLNSINYKKGNNINSSNKYKTMFIKSREKIKKTLSKRYSIFKRINEYLESNDIPLFEILNRNPFQNKPYQISKGFEFLEAVKFKNYRYVKEALQASNDFLFVFDYYGQTCYHWAAKLGDIKMLTLLLDYGKHHNQKDFKGRTPLHLAAANNNKQICDFLLRNKANIHLLDNFGRNAADVAGSKELNLSLGDIASQPFSNPNFKKRMADFMRKRQKDIEEAKLKKQFKEKEVVFKSEDENENKEEE